MQLKFSPKRSYVVYISPHILFKFFKVLVSLFKVTASNATADKLKYLLVYFCGAKQEAF